MGTSTLTFVNAEGSDADPEQALATSTATRVNGEQPDSDACTSPWHRPII